VDEPEFPEIQVITVSVIDGQLEVDWSDGLEADDALWHMLDALVMIRDSVDEEEDAGAPEGD
jgi:hypothetical protein